ncbi:hypothetical protein, partial [Rossellomorea marisflavi]|uniref:hypothetical protein n=1 Tax=Rossellomorea marisflavi TaxID=189381 RepID=UPI00345DFAAA
TFKTNFNFDGLFSTWKLYDQLPTFIIDFRPLLPTSPCPYSIPSPPPFSSKAKEDVILLNVSIHKKTAGISRRRS